MWKKDDVSHSCQIGSFCLKVWPIKNGPFQAWVSLELTDLPSECSLYITDLTNLAAAKRAIEKEFWHFLTEHLRSLNDVIGKGHIKSESYIGHKYDAMDSAGRSGGKSIYEPKMEHLIEGRVSKGGQNPPNPDAIRPSPPQGSHAKKEKN